MGADGGLVMIPLKESSDENHIRVFSLLKPFWQFYTTDDISSVASEANRKFKSKNDLNGYFVGCYGTDRCDHAELGELRSICTPFVDDYYGDLYSLTFGELDLECRTSMEKPNADYTEHPLRKLWAQHFDLMSREDVLEHLGSLSNIIISDWVSELNSLLKINNVCYKETWT